MAEGETKLKRTHARSWGVNAALVTALAIAAIATFFILRDWQRTRLSFRLDDEVSVHLVSVLHDGNEELEPRAWLRKLYARIPEELKTITTAWWRPETVLVRESLEQSQIALVFRPQVRRSSSTAPGEEGLRQQAYSSALSSDIGLRLRFANGGYTGIEAISALQNYHSMSGGNGWGHFFGCTFDPVPLTAKELTVEVVSGDASAIEVIKQVKIPNPTYRKMKPIGAALTLPATVTHDGVSVTLEALVSNTISGLMRKPPPASSDIVDPETLQFRRHDGKAVRPSTTGAAIRVNDTGSTESDWRVNELQFLYGDNIPHPQPDQWNPLNLSLERGLVQIFTFPNDVGVISHPVKVTAHLVRQRDFQPEHMLTYTTELPTTGTYTTEMAPLTNIDPGLRKHHRSNWRTDLQIANQTAIPYTRMDANQEGLLTLILMSHNELAHIHSVKLITFDGSVRDLAGYLVNETQRNQSGQSYDLHNRRQNPNTPAIDSSLVDTIQVTVVDPEVFHREFNFIVTPSAAQLPAVPGIY